MTSHPTNLLPELDLCVDGQLSAADSARLRDLAAEDSALRQEMLGLERLQDLLVTARVEVEHGFVDALAEALVAEDAEQERFAQCLRSERIEVRPGFVDDVVESVQADVVAEGAVADLLAASRVDVRESFTEGVLAAVATEREAPCAVAATLAQARVEVRPDFADRVMESVHGESAPAASAARWTLAGAAAALLLLVGSMAILGGTGDSGLGLLGMLGDFASMTLLAGAGMLGATWAGVGSTVDAWLGSSVANWAVALMVVAGLAFLCQRTVRRARVRVRRD